MTEQEHRIIIFTEGSFDMNEPEWGWMCAVDNAEGVGYEDRDAADAAAQEHVR
jgi:hypothetical protein